MSMLGNLADFSLPELLKMFEKSARTGQLSVWGPGGYYRILFSQGRIVGGVSPEEQQSLLKIITELVALDVDKKQLSGLTEPLGKYLKSKKLVNSSTLASAFRKQVQETIYPLFALESGQFRFSNKAPVLYEEMTGLSKSSIEIALDGFRSLQENNQTLEELPALDSAYCRVDKELPLLKLATHEWSILENLASTKKLNQLSQMLQIDAKEVQRVCARLEKVALIRKVESAVNVGVRSASNPKLQSGNSTALKPVKTVQEKSAQIQSEDKKKKVNSRLLNRFASLLKSI